jgi:predicted RNase H-like nuclease
MRGLPRSCLSVIQGVCRCRCVCTVSSCREVIWTVVYGATTVESVCGAGVLDCKNPDSEKRSFGYNRKEGDVRFRDDEADSALCDTVGALVAWWSSLDSVSGKQASDELY